ncbi:uncharacterized protein [Atheta coriaria]|uniref:uncharacterized protein n=1 Tax=Dalotia coriaria TaxID=877792 RepID=UPI0031F37D47
MATYAAYRHIELDKVGYSKKRVRNPPTEIHSVLATPPSSGKQTNGRTVVDGASTPRRRGSDSFNRLFGESGIQVATPRRASLTKHDVKNRNPVTGNGVQTWENKANRSPKVHSERNPVTGEVYQIISPATTPTKPMTNDFPKMNGNAELPAGPVTNGQA